jgi:hypothetical protein
MVRRRLRMLQALTSLRDTLAVLMTAVIVNDPERAQTPLKRKLLGLNRAMAIVITSKAEDRRGLLCSIPVGGRLGRERHGAL